MILLNLVSQASSALGAAASQNFSAVGSLHSASEAVNLAALSLLRLISTNHVLHLPN